MMRWPFSVKRSLRNSDPPEGKKRSAGNRAKIRSKSKGSHRIARATDAVFAEHSVRLQPRRVGVFRKPVSPRSTGGGGGIAHASSQRHARRHYARRREQLVDGSAEPFQ